MRYYLDELLEALEKEYPKSLTVNSLRKKIGDDVDGTIHEAVSRELITYPTYKPNGGTLGTDDRVFLGIKGFEVLNQIKIKEAIEDFNESSNKASTQLNDSIKSFNESNDKASKTLNRYTILLIILTLFLAALTIIGMLASWFEKFYGENAPSVIIGLIIFSFILSLIAFYISTREN